MIPRPTAPRCVALILHAGLWSALGAQAPPGPRPKVPEITNQNLDQFRPGTLAMAQGAAASAPPPGTTGPALIFPKDRGAHPGAPRERWSLKAMLRSPAGGIFPFQVTFLRRELGGAPQEGAWSHTRFLTAQATLGSDQGRILSDARRARLGLPGQAQEDRLGLRCDGWSISDPGDGWLHVDIPLRGGRVRLNLALKGDPLSLPPLEPGDPLQRTLRTRLEAEGRLELEGRAPVPVSGRALLLQEWGPEVPAEVNGWDRAFLFLRDGRSLLYLGTRASQPSQTARPLLLEINAQGLPSVAHRPPAAKVLRFWSSPLSRTRYPVALQIQDPRQPLTFEPAADTQEWVGDWVGALTFWSGAGLLKNPQGAPIGEGFLELAGYAHPVQGRF